MRIGKVSLPIAALLVVLWQSQSITGAITGAPGNKNDRWKRSGIRSLSKVSHKHRGQHAHNRHRHRKFHAEAMAPGVALPDRGKRKNGGGEAVSLRAVSRMRERARLFEPEIAAMARKYGVDPRVLWTIAYLETRFRSNLVSPKQAMGLMQFIPGTAKRYGLVDPMDGAQSIEAAAKYVRDLSAAFDGRLDLILASYNAGEGCVSAYLLGQTIRTRDGKIINPRALKTTGVPPYRETQKYVARGIAVYSLVAANQVFSTASVNGTLAVVLPSRGVLASLREQVRLEFTSGAKSGGQRTAPSAGPIVGQSSSALEEVFFDIFSGVRYLVKNGEIVGEAGRLPAGSSDPSASTNQAGANSRARAARSIYYGPSGSEKR